MEWTQIKLILKDQLAIMIIDNPPVNALNATVMNEISQVIEQIENSKDLRALIIMGGGEKAFVAGADITQFMELDDKSGKALSSVGQEIFNRIENLGIPTISALNGYTLGAGCELALACDIRVAEEHVLIGLPEVSLGILPGYGGTQRLPKLVGIGKAKELILTGDPIPAEEAYRIGLVEKLVPKGESLKHAEMLARITMLRGPLAIKNAKKAINESYRLSPSAGMDLEGTLFAELCKTHDKNEGAQAFIEKRKPNFKGE